MNEILKGKTSAEWYVEFLVLEMKNILSSNPTIRLEEVIEKAILKSITEMKRYEVEHNIKLEEYDSSPMPSVGIPEELESTFKWSLR